MKNINQLLLGLALIIITLFISGCVNIKTQKDTSGIDGGVFKSYDKGTIWRQKVLIPTTSGRPANFSGVNSASMVFDPSDNQAIYFGSIGNGMVYTYDGAESWRLAEGLGRATIQAIAVDPKSKCTIYAAIGNRVFKSIDCSRTWSQVYFDNSLATVVNAIAIDHFNTNRVFIGLSRGDIILSSDAGDSWQTVYRAKNSINKFGVDPNDSRHIYAMAARSEVFRSFDSGETWEDLNSVLRDFGLSSNMVDVAFVKDEPGRIILATQFGMLRSGDNGETWEKIELLLPDRNAGVNAIAVNPKDSQEIYYVTNTTFYRTVDGGENWTPIKLPTSRWGWRLLVDPEQPNIIYLGVYAPPK